MGFFFFLGGDCLVFVIFVCVCVCVWGGGVVLFLWLFFQSSIHPIYFCAGVSLNIHSIYPCIG